MNDVPETPPSPTDSELWVVPQVGVRTLLERAPQVIDLRSPSEFALDHLPGAQSVPLFDDVERAVVGTLYKRESPGAAFDEARRLARHRIAALVKEIARAADWSPPIEDLEARLDRMAAAGVEGLEGGLLPRLLPEPPARAVVLHCWRGGLRSRSVVAFLRALGFDRAVQLEGGYKAYRKQVLRELDGARFPRTFVLRGLTGVGKTLVLRELESLRPGWTVDLEGLAGHRSSILGMVGLEPCTQKTFDSRLAARLRAGLGERVVFEGESRKVGDTILPSRLWSALATGTNVELTAPTEVRVRVLIDDYLATPESRDELREKLPFIESRLGARKWAGELVRRLDDGREEELVEILLERYYDPLYAHSEERKAYALSVDSSDPARAAASIAAWIEDSAGGNSEAVRSAEPGSPLSRTSRP